MYELFSCQTTSCDSNNVHYASATSTFARRFLNVGVDFCGSLYIKKRRFRNQNRIKVYIAVYVRLTTRAVHFEVDNDLTTEVFLTSLKRLFARRGWTHLIYSDNATNFVGVNRELKKLQDIFESENFKEKFQHFTTMEKFKWEFISPRSSHFAGLWEAMVKSFKHHLLCIVSNNIHCLHSSNFKQ